MRYLYLGLVTVLASNICVDSTQAASVTSMPTEDDGIVLGFTLPDGEVVLQETPQDGSHLYPWAGVCSVSTTSAEAASMGSGSDALFSLRGSESYDKTRDPRLLNNNNQDNVVLPEDLGGWQELASVEGDPDDEEFKLSSSEEEMKPLPVATAKGTTLVGGNMAQRGAQKQRPDVGFAGKKLDLKLLERKRL